MREGVWVHKVVNPRSAVLTYGEAFEIVKKAKDRNHKPRTKAECFTLTKLPLPSSEQRKADIVKLNNLLIKADELKEVIDMRKQLREIGQSKDELQKAIDSKVLLPNGLGKVLPSRTRQKERQKVDKKVPVKTDSAWKKLNNLPTDMLNYAALGDLADDIRNDKEAEKDKSSDEEEEDIVVPKKKRRLVVESDDEEDVAPFVKKEIVTPSTSTENVGAVKPAIYVKEEVVSPSSSVTKMVATHISDDEDMASGFLAKSTYCESALNFGKDYCAAIDRWCEHPKVVTCEDGRVNLMIKPVFDSFQETGLTNPMFTDDAVNEFFKDKDATTATLDEKWIKQVLPSKSSREVGDQYIEFERNRVTQSTKFPKTHERTDYDFLMDKKFKQCLLDCKSTLDVNRYLGLEMVEDKEDETDDIPSNQLLNSLFTIEEAEIMKFTHETAFKMLEFARDKKRVQHQPVEKRLIATETSLTAAEEKEMNRLLSDNKCDVKRVVLPSSLNQKYKGPKFNKINHNTICHNVLRYLESRTVSHRSLASNARALKVLSKYTLSFVEKYNLLTLAPKDLPGMLCLLDDFGLRFDQETAMDFEVQCESMYSKEDTIEANVRKAKHAAWLKSVQSRPRNPSNRRQSEDAKHNEVAEDKPHGRTRRSSRNK